MSHGQSAELFGDYRIVKEIARGGMASVSLAFQSTSVGLERRVVIKSVLQHMTDNQDFVTMFVDEARLMMSFSHPHIAQVFEAGQLEGRHFIAMEYVQGVTLSQMIKAARKSGEHIPYEVAFGLALALSEALAYVHQRCDEYGNWLSIIHRDLKPSNVLVGYDGVVKLIDFGIAQAASKQHQTKTGVLKGTVGYLAPEQILDEPVDQRADVFTLGLLLYQTFVGKYPFLGRNDAQRLRALINGEPIDPKSCRPDCPDALSHLLLKCLSSSPKDRFYMRELVRELASCARQMGLTPHFQVISDWVQTNLRGDQEQESNPEQLLRPVLGKLRASLRPGQAGQSLTALTPDTPQSRAQVIEEKLDELDPLFESATLFDVSVQHSHEERFNLHSERLGARPGGSSLPSTSASAVPPKNGAAPAPPASTPSRSLFASTPAPVLSSLLSSQSDSSVPPTPSASPAPPSLPTPSPVVPPTPSSGSGAASITPPAPSSMTPSTPQPSPQAPYSHPAVADFRALGRPVDAHLAQTRPVNLADPQVSSALSSAEMSGATGELFQPSAQELEYTNILDKRRFRGVRRGDQGSSGALDPRTERILIIAGVLIALAVLAGFAYLLAS